MARAAHEDLGERLLHRLLFFTDAVFAIVLTLLVLELRPPLHDPRGLAALAGPFAAMALSFAVISIFWVAHMATTRLLVHFDWPAAIANLVFLFCICLIPTVSIWVGENLVSGDGWAAYCGVLVATSLANAVLVLVQSRGGGRLMQGGVTRRERLYRLGRALSPGVAFGIGLIGLAAGEVRLAQFCWLLIPLFVRLCEWTLKPKAAAPATT